MKNIPISKTEDIIVICFNDEQFRNAYYQMYATDEAFVNCERDTQSRKHEFQINDIEDEIELCVIFFQSNECIRTNFNIFPQ